ncbi:MAG: type II toxin-antitoxin system RelE/ParE family toxin [Actinobacteria bacterium]|nr:type II toxin-antitoxin system RelE/ParE family toxin [Actinomycetota bacterium]
MIRSFRDNDTRRLFERSPVRRFGNDVRRAAFRKLRMLDAAVNLADLRVPPGNRLERLKGARTGEYSIRINDQWRICFRWEPGEAHDVEIVDYH